MDWDPGPHPGHETNAFLVHLPWRLVFGWYAGFLTMSSINSSVTSRWALKCADMCPALVNDGLRLPTNRTDASWDATDEYVYVFSHCSRKSRRFCLSLKLTIAEDYTYLYIRTRRVLSISIHLKKYFDFSHMNLNLIFFILHLGSVTALISCLDACKLLLRVIEPELANESPNELC